VNAIKCDISSWDSEEVQGKVASGIEVIPLTQEICNSVFFNLNLINDSFHSFLDEGFQIFFNIFDLNEFTVNIINKLIMDQIKEILPSRISEISGISVQISKD